MPQLPARPAPREDPRVVRSRSCILAAAVALLEEEGATGLTIEGVAARSGVAKTTIYRQWPDRNELLIAAYEQIVVAEPVEPSADLLADVRAFLARLDAALHADSWSRILPGLVDLAERDEALAEMCRHFAERRRAALIRRLERGRAEGQLACDVDADLLAAELVGPVFYRRYFARTRFTEAELGLHVDRTLGAVTTTIRP